VSRIELVARTLCRASCNGPVCPFCGPKGAQCDPAMWQTFTKEAEAVLGALAAAGALQPVGHNPNYTLSARDSALIMR
jgi:hypothetical protein